MSVSLHRIQKAVLRTIRGYEADRIKNSKPAAYDQTKAGMLRLHEEWQQQWKDLLELVKQNDSPARAAIQAVRFAAACMKFAADLGDSDLVKQYYEFDD